jgi:hypothetical protein
LASFAVAKRKRQQRGKEEEAEEGPSKRSKWSAKVKILSSKHTMLNMMGKKRAVKGKEPKV